MSATSDDEVRRLVDFIVRSARGRFGEDVLIVPEEMTAIREAAKRAHAAWKAQSSEDFASALDGLSVGGKKLDFDALDIGDVDDIVSAEEERGREERKLERQAEEKKSAQKTLFVLASVVGGVGIIGFLMLRDHFESKGETKNGKTETKHAERQAATAPTNTATVAPEAPARVSVSSCTCISRANGKNTFVLEAPASKIDDWHVDWTQQAEFLTTHSGFAPGASDAGAATSLVTGATKLRAAMACENEILAVVAGDVASAWSATESGELLWTRKLPAAMAESSDAGARDDISCADAFSVTGNVFTVPLAKGKKITLSIRDGSVH